MQAELDAAGLPVTLVGVNMIGSEPGVSGMAAGNSIALLQDTTAVDAEAAWSVTWRDLFILDEDNELVDVINLSSFNLDNQANYDVIHDLLVQTATD